MPIIQSGKPLSDIIGAHDLSDFVLQVENVSPLSPILDRGSVVCRLPNGQMTLAGTQATGVEDVYGVVLDFQVDPTRDAPAITTCSVARSGVFNAEQLIVNNDANLKDYEDRLREIGIFLEKLELLPPPAGARSQPSTIKESIEHALKSPSPS